MVLKNVLKNREIESEYMDECYNNSLENKSIEEKQKKNNFSKECFEKSEFCNDISSVNLVGEMVTREFDRNIRVMFDCFSF
jgi:hypothetical protein